MITKLPGIGAIRSCLSSLAFAPDKTKFVREMFSVGGTNYMTLRSIEVVKQYNDTGNVADLDMAIQLLAALKVMKHGGGQKIKQTGDSGEAGEKDPG